MTLFERRPFNLRYVVRQPLGLDPERKRATHGTAECNWAYIMRQTIRDEYGPTPDFASRTDLVDCGRAGPTRALKAAWAGRELWRMMDRLSLVRRPDQATAVHMVGSLPAQESAERWRQIVQEFVEDELAAKGMIADWAIHFKPPEAQTVAVPPHVHILATVRMVDRDPGRRNFAWFGSEQQVRRAGKKWSDVSGMWPAPLVMVA